MNEELRDELAQVKITIGGTKPSHGAWLAYSLAKVLTGEGHVAHLQRPGEKPEHWRRGQGRVRFLCGSVYVTIIIAGPPAVSQAEGEAAEPGAGGTP
jgi:hypothetical protein